MAPVHSSLPDISMTQLQYLVAVQESPTWASAAAALGVSQSALSQGLAELQRRLGIELFSWNGRRRVPASSTAEVTEHARRILALTSDLSGWSDRIRAGSGETLRSFREDRPQLDLHVTVGPSSQLLQGLTSGDLDLSICVSPQDPNFSSVALLEEDLYVYAPPGVRPSGPQEWGPWVTFPTGSLTRDLIGEALRSTGSTFSVVAESNQPEVLSEMVLIGMGWTVLPRIQAERPPASLTPVQKTPLLKRSLVAATRDSNLVNPAASELVSALLQQAGRAPQSPK